MRENAPDWYLADLLLPTLLRDQLIVLHAFHVEVTNITLAVQEPLAGELRLQWWSDVVAGKRREETLGHPVASALLDLMESHQLPPEAFEAKLQAHIFDLYQDPMEELTMLEGYLGETRSVLFQLACQIFGIDNETIVADACGHAGVATGIVVIIEQMARHRNSSRVYIPCEILSNNNLNSASFLSQIGQDHEAVILELIALAQDHYEKALLAINQLPVGMRIVFKPLAVVPYYLNRARSSPSKALIGFPHPSQLRRQWAFWRF